jgi:acyl-coenzyme A thioesterase PaaI-like protein
MVSLPRVSIDTDIHKNLCFGCGQNNPIGLKLSFTKDGNTLKAECTPDKLYQGWPGVLHGGIVACLLDEAMSNAAYFEGITCITATMQIRLRQVVQVEVPLVITASITKNRRKIIETKARVCLKDGTVVAESTAKQFVIEAETGNGSDSQEPQNNA